MIWIKQVTNILIVDGLQFIVVTNHARADTDQQASRQPFSQLGKLNFPNQ